MKSCLGGALRPPEAGGQRGPIGAREGRVLSKPCHYVALEPPLARSRLRLDRAALLTQEGVARLPNRTSFAKPASTKAPQQHRCCRRTCPDGRLPSPTRSDAHSREALASH